MMDTGAITQPAGHSDTSVTPRQIFAIAWPLALKTIMLQGAIVIDAYLVAPLGEATLAAMGLAGVLGGLLLGILFAFSNATQIRIAQAFGRSGPVQLKTAYYCGLVNNLTAIAIGLLFVVMFGPGIINAFTQTEQIATWANAYLGVFLLAVICEAVAQSLSSYFDGCGRTRMNFVSYLLALPLNVALSVVLIYGLYGFPEMGLVGAAVGTVVSSFIRLAFLSVVFLRENGAFLNVPGWAQGSFLAAFRRHFKFSWPIGVTFISMSIGNQICTLIYAKMSINAFAAMTIILPWVHVVGTLGMAWAQATGICVAQMLGRGASETALDAFLSRAWRFAFVAAGLVCASYLVFCLSAVRIYDSLQAETTNALLWFLPTLLVLPFPKGSNAICGQTLRASGDTFYVMNVFIAGQWLFKVPMTFLCVVVLGLPVVWVFSIILMEELFKFPLFHRQLRKGAWKRPLSELS
jgi:Na+-driven multidrug efflux pump